MSFQNNDQELSSSRQRANSRSSAPQRHPSVTSSQRTPSIISARNYSGDKFMPIANSIEASVTKLLVITKQLLESLTRWSKGLAGADDVSSIYVRLVAEFNITIKIFKEVGIESLDLDDFPLELRSILEETLAENPSTDSLQAHLPHVREIIIHLLKSLKYKQSLYKSRYLRPRKESQASRESTEENTQRREINEYNFINKSLNSEKSSLNPLAFSDTPHALDALKQSSSLERRASKRFSKMNKNTQQGLNDTIQKNEVTVESVRDLLNDSQVADYKPPNSSVSNPTIEPRSVTLGPFFEETGWNDLNKGRNLNRGSSRSNSMKLDRQSFSPSYPSQRNYNSYEMNNLNTPISPKKDQRSPQRSMTTSSATRSFSSGKTASPNFLPSGTPVLLPRGRSFTSPIPNEASTSLGSRFENSQEIRRPSQEVESFEEYNKVEKESDRDLHDLQQSKRVSEKSNFEPNRESTRVRENKETEDQLKIGDAETKESISSGLNAEISINEMYQSKKNDSLEELDRLVRNNSTLLPKDKDETTSNNEEKHDSDYTSGDERPSPSGIVELADDNSQTPKEVQNFANVKDEPWDKKGEVKGEFEQAHRNFVYFLKLNNRTRKAISPFAVDTQEKLQALFQSKFENEFEDVPFEFYIEDYDTKVNYLLEDYSDMKFKSLIIAQKQLKVPEESPVDNVEAVGEATRPYEIFSKDDGINNSSIFEEILQRLNVIERKLGSEHITNATIQSSSASKTAKSDKVVTNATNYQQVKNMQLDLASLKQVFAASFTKIPLQLNEFRKQMGIINEKASGFGFDRGYILKSKDTIEAVAKSLVERFDDINDQIELLRSDVLLRKVRPGLDQISYLVKEKESIESSIHELQKAIEEVTPTWKKQWEKELNAIVQEQEFLDNHTNLITDLNKDLDSITTVLSNVSAIAELQAKSSIKSKPLAVKPSAGDMKEIREKIHMDVLKLRPDSDVRLQAIERFEAFQRKKVLFHEDEFAKELKEFIKDDNLRNIGGVEEVERRRSVQDEQNRKILWKDAFNNTEKISITSTEEEKRRGKDENSPTDVHLGILDPSQINTAYNYVSNGLQDNTENSAGVVLPPTTTLSGPNNAEEVDVLNEKENDPSQIDNEHDGVSSELPENVENRSDVVLPATTTLSNPNNAEEKGTLNEKEDIARVGHHRRNDTLSTDDYEAFQDAEDENNSLT
ncbi:actin interacting protein 3 Bud6 [Schizosaccharomyces cryophilus OY26]|uniref:Actin interacting protein 3 Bud6 n=1 Tax=Schizosaccharomyces cryophilus (strain OY26 / ATCC MYA-4695 / CBS 11777 / NBRC 106824 / NRRL Y48691) TaxID=653667 RepID=S9VZF2_SCHCR|nr:actin interacting protein 3 Bud6 [Schizosaccharomyces cryophilus OY26]EPY53013.1 actin interacting protein 3 Bud6 [Schizosaccharomyces cryophilus OY26]